VNPTRLRARSYRSFDHLDLPLPAGCAAIVGDNGAGKSSIVAGIDLALFGPESRSWSPYVAEGSDELMLELTFDHGGETYRVRRGFSAAGRGKATLDLETLSEGGRKRTASKSDGARPSGREASQCQPPSESASWTPETRATIADTERYLGEILGMSRRTLRASSLLLQGQGGTFTESDPSKRMEILIEILALERFAGWLAAVRTEKRKAENELTAIAAVLANAEVELAERPQVETAIAFAIEAGMDAAKKLDEVEGAAEGLSLKLQEIEKAQAELQAARAERGAAEERLRSLELIEREAKEAAEQLGEIRKRLETLPDAQAVQVLQAEEAELQEADAGYQRMTAEYQAQRREAEFKRAERETILAQAKDLKERAADRRNRADGLDEHGPGEARCDRCEQILGAEPHAAAVASLRVEADELDAGARDLEAQAATVDVPEVVAPPIVEPPAAALERVRVRLASAREGLLERSGLEGRVTTLEAAAAKVGGDFRADIATARIDWEDGCTAVVMIEENAPRPSALGETRLALDEARQQVAVHRDRVSQTDADRVRAEQRREQLDALAHKVEAETSRREGVQAELDVLHVLEAAYGRNGMPTQQIERILPQIESEADTLLQKLGTPYRVELRTERETKAGGVAETLDVVVLTEAGARPYETFSGGERTRINLALRISLARLLAHRRGAESRLLVVDEPEFLDAAGTAALAEVLRGLESDFDSILLVSHVPDLRDAFESALTVSRNGSGGSEVSLV
jgi:exonuclease SbcC